MESAPQTSAAVTLTVNNKLSQSVNVYVVSGSTDHFLKQVSANSTEDLPVSGMSVGSTVRLKATTADGSKTYTKDGVVLSERNSWDVP